MPFKCWIASLGRSDEYSSMTWARWAASETAARCPKGFHPHTHTLLLHLCCKVLWSSVVALYSPYLAAYISFYPVPGQWQDVNKELTNAVKIFVDSQGRICKFTPAPMAINNEHIGEKLLCVLMLLFFFSWRKNNDQTELERKTHFVNWKKKI